MSNSELLEVLVHAVQAGMLVVKKAQLVGRKRQAEIKAEDATLLTETDEASGRAMFSILARVTGASVDMEDAGQIERDGPLLLWGDPLDGTRAFTNGLATSTCIAAAFDRDRKKLVAVAIGEPATGRIWAASEDEPTVERLSGRTVRVWQGRLDKQATICVDVSHGFKNLLTDADVVRLFALLNCRANIFIPGSNGLIQALVANGGERLAGGITTAKGGPWDLVGVFLVLRVGGAVRAFTISEDRQLVEQDPLDPTSFDLAVYGNSQETVVTLVGALQDALSGKLAENLQL